MIEPTAPDQNPPAPSIHMDIWINFDGMIWGALRQFVALADRDRDIPDSEEVAFKWDEDDIDDPCSAPIGLTFSSGGV